MISDHKSLAELYSELLIRGRDINRRNAAGMSICMHCNCTKKTHLADGRCSTSAISQTFHNNEQVDLNRINRAIELIEELRDL